MNRDLEKKANSGKIELIRSLITQFEELRIDDEGKLDALRRRATMIISKTCGDSSPYLKDSKNITFYPMAYPTSTEAEHRIWATGQREMINLLTKIIEDLSLTKIEVPPANENEKKYSNRVFIVHGHDDLEKERLAHILYDIGLNPVILHDQPNKGRTIIEKFEQEACDVGYAFILMTPDDLGIESKLYEEIKKDEKKGGLCFRPRQNVVLEMGFFFAKLGRGRVCCLAKGNLEKPTDISGVVYISFINKVDEAYREITKELRAAGYDLKSP